MADGELTDAGRAFDAIAEQFDGRFGGWLSVAAQRQAVRAALAAVFPPGAQVLELAGGTGEDALWLAERGRKVLLTDASPAMVRVAARKLADHPGSGAEVLAAEALDDFAGRRLEAGLPQLDGAFSNFAGLNCVTDLRPVAHGLAGLVRTGGAAVLVVFGAACPGEILVEGLCGRPHNMFRRLRAREAPARLGGRSFTVRYHSRAEIVRAMAPWFRLRARQGIGVFVPPSAAEPWISRHPQLLAALARLDRALAGPLAPLGDHVLYRLERTAEEVRPP